MLRACERVRIAALICSLGLIPSWVRAQMPCYDADCLPNAAPAPSSAPSAAPARASIDDESPQAAPGASPTMFAAPQPSGDIGGARRSVLLPSLQMSIPKITIETPEFRFRGPQRFRRGPEMHLDGGVAPATNMQPVMAAPLLQSHAPATAAPARSNPPAPAPASPPSPAPAPAPPEEPCAWNQGQQEVRELTAQVRQLQAMMLQLAEVQAASASVRQGEEPSYDIEGSQTRRAPSRPRAPYRDYEVEAERLRLEDALYQRNEEIQILQARMNQLQRQHKVLLEQNLYQINRDQESRLRDQLEEEQPEIVQSGYDHGTAQPRRMPSRPQSMPIERDSTSYGWRRQSGADAPQ